MYYGYGTLKNYQKAAYWVRKAYEHGYEDAKKAWDELKLWRY